MLFTPFMICVMLKYMQKLSVRLTGASIIDYPINNISKMSKCWDGPEYKGEDPPCLTIGYSIIGEQSKNDEG